MRTWFFRRFRLPESRPRFFESRTSTRLTLETLEDREVLASPLIVSTTPSPFYSGGIVPSWTTTVNSVVTQDTVIKVTFDSSRTPTSQSAANLANYEIFDITTGTTVAISGVTYASSTRTATITLASELPIGPDQYRFTVKDSIVGSDGLKLDGDADGTAGGNFTRTFTVAPKSFSVSGFPNTITSGTPAAVTVTALDALGNVATGYRGAVRFTSADSKAVLPPEYSFTESDNGTHSFTVTLNNSGTKSITATDTTASSITGKQSNIIVTPGPAAALSFSLPSSTAGAASTATVSVKDAAGNVVTDYRGTVRFTSNDTQAVLPEEYTFTAADAGVHTFTFTLKTAGSKSIAVTDTVSGITKSTSSTVSAAAFSLFTFTPPSSITAGASFILKVAAKDAFGNTITGYRGTVHFTSSDSAAVLPANYTFTAADAGLRDFSLTFNTAGPQTVTVTDAAAGVSSTSTIAPIPVRYAAGSNTIYVTGNVTVTLSDILAAVPTAPLVLVDAAQNIWLLKANLILQQGATLNLKSTALGGDVNELRLMSNNVAGAAFNIVKVSADWGNITIDGVRVSSWDEAVGGVDTEVATYGRAFIQVRSSLDADGVTARESRMDINNSDLGYLGYDASEAYGLSWKVIGEFGAAVTDATGNPTYELFEKVNVYGNITNSRLHHNWFGQFSYGAYGMQIINNEVYSNIGYGLDPHDDSDYLLIKDNYVHHNGYDGIIISKRCDHVQFINNISAYNGQNGLFFHYLSNDSVMEGNQALYNGGVGITVYASDRSIIRNNVSTGNYIGFRLIAGSSYSLIENNDFGFNTNYGIHTVTGSDDVSGDGRMHKNIIRNNVIHDNASFALRIVNADDTLIQGNTFANNGSVTLSFDDGQRNRLDGNTFQTNQLVVTNSSSAINSTTYISNQPFARVNPDSRSSIIFEDATGKTFDMIGFSVPTVIAGPNQSSLTVTKSMLGVLSVVRVESRALQVQTSAGQSVSVVPTAWEVTGSARKEWTAQPTAADQPMTFTIGNMVANTPYVILRDGNVLSRVFSNASGVVTFSDISGSTDVITYSIAADGATVDLTPLPATTAGVEQSFTLTIRDAFGQIVTNYVGTVQFTTTDPLGVVPAEYTFNAADAGVKTFTATFKTAGLQSITVTDLFNPSLTATEADIAVYPGPVEHFQVAGIPDVIVAGTTAMLTVTAQDAYGNTVDGYLGTVHFTSTDLAAQLPADYTFTTSDAGMQTFAVVLTTTGARTITVTDVANEAILGKQQSIAVTPAAAASFIVGGFTDPVAAGTPGGFTVIAMDVYGNVATDYLGTVTFTSTDSLASLPLAYTFTSEDAGTHAFSAILYTAGSQTITATDGVAVTGEQTPITVTPATSSITYTLESVPSNPVAGTPISLTIVIRDPFGNLVPNFTGTVHFGSSDLLAELPADYTFIEADGGRKTFSVVFKTAGTQVLSFGDGAAATEAIVQVVPAAVSSFLVTGIVSPTTAGMQQTITVSAKDIYGNIATNYLGSIQFTSTDLGVVLPVNYTFTADDQGSHTFLIALVTVGTRSITVADTTNAAIVGSQQGIIVLPGAAASFVVSGFATPVQAGTPSTFVVTAKDAHGNVASGYAGTVTFTSTDPFAILPPEYTFTATDLGSYTFTATLYTSGSQTITATDAVALISGRQSAIRVQPQAYSTIEVKNYPVATAAGTSQNLEVRLLDIFGNVVTNYTGTVYFSSSDLQAVLPAAYTFTPADHGNKIFAVTLKTAGIQSIAVTDSLTGLAGTQSGISVTPSTFKKFGIIGDLAPAVAGTSYAFTVVAQDTYGNPTPYLGTVQFASTDLAGVLPPDYTFTAADNGIHTFNITFYTAGLRTITVTDSLDPTALGKLQNILVNGAAAAYFTVTIPSSVQSGTPFNVTVSAKDQFGNFTTNYLGTVHFTSSDLGAFLPPDYTFTSEDFGTHTFVAGASLAVTGIKNIEATDTANPTITGKMSTNVVASPYIWVAATNTIYISGITVTLSDIHNLLPTAPLTLLDATNHIWRLDANLLLLNGATLNIHGTSIGGDVNELRLRSNNYLLSDGTPAPNNTIWIKAAYGNIDIRYTKITSWDDARNGADINPGQIPPRDDDEGDDNNGVAHARSYIAVISSLASDGVTALESRMDIDHSDIGYLGSHTTTGYGLSWKAEGYGADDHAVVRVYGSATNSRIHDNFFGIYTYGGYDMDFLYNEVDHNIWYGIDPHDDTNNSRFMYNYTHDNGTHGIILSQRCNDNIIAYNTSVDNEHHGIMLHRSSNRNQVYGNIVEGNGDVGIAIFESFDNSITNNTIHRNYKGIRFSMGSGNNVVDSNDIGYNLYDGIDFIPGSDPPLVSVNPDRRSHDNVISNNTIHDNAVYAIKITESDDITFANNTFTNESLIKIIDSTNITLTGNTLPAGLVVSSSGTANLTTSTFIQNQASTTVQADSYSTFTFGDSTGSILKATTPGLGTLVQSTGSQLVLTKALLGSGTATVTSLNLKADTPTGAANVVITPVAWPADPAAPRSWTTQQSTAADLVTYTVGGLTSGSVYIVRLNSTALTMATAASDGTIQFQAAAGTTSAVTFQIEKSIGPNLPNATAANISYSSSSATITVTGAVMVTPTVLKALLPAGVIDLVDSANHIWYLKANLVLKQGAVLVLFGTSVGGDTDLLRLRSNNSSSTGAVVSIKADWGQVLMDSTKVTSWMDTGAVMTTPGSGGRAFIQVTSSKDSSSVIRESTMNIVNSEVSYLGSSDTKPGLYWTVNSTDPAVLAQVHVNGTVTNSKIHHNYYGLGVRYADGGLTFTNNEIYSNLNNGISLRYYASNQTITGNHIHDNVGAGIYVTNNSTSLTIKNNTFVRNTTYGITFQTGSGSSIVEGNTITDNASMGIYLTESDGSTYRNNTILRNPTNIKIDKASDLNVFTNNEIAFSTAYGIQILGGSGSGVGRGNTFDGNNIHDNATKAISVDASTVTTADSNVFVNNTITGTAAQAIAIAKVSGVTFQSNTITDNVTMTLSGTSSRPTLVKFFDQSKATVKVSDAYSSVRLWSSTGAVWKVGSTTAATTVAANGVGSTLLLTRTNLGSSAVLITTRRLLATTNTGTATIDSSGWSSTPTVIKTFIVKAANTTQSLTFTLGDLTPGGTYLIKKNGATITSVVADAFGYATLTNTIGSTSNVTFTLTPA